MSTNGSKPNTFVLDGQEVDIRSRARPSSAPRAATA